MITSEWVSGLLSMIMTAGIIVGVSVLMAYVVIRIWGSESELTVTPVETEAEPSRLRISA